MADFDQLSMEMLMNKSQYDKYLSKTNPAESNARKKFHKSIKRHKPEILKLTKQFLDDPTTDFNLSVNAILENYAKTVIQYIQMKSIDNKTNGGCYENDYDEDEGESKSDESEEDNDSGDEGTANSDTYIPNRRVESFWGKQINKGTNK